MVGTCAAHKRKVSWAHDMVLVFPAQWRSLPAHRVVHDVAEKLKRPASLAGGRCAHKEMTSICASTRHHGRVGCLF